jgi:hypothetical protein
MAKGIAATCDRVGPGHSAETGWVPFQAHAPARRRLASATTWEARLACPARHPLCDLQGAKGGIERFASPARVASLPAPDGGREGCPPAAPFGRRRWRNDEGDKERQRPTSTAWRPIPPRLRSEASIWHLTNHSLGLVQEGLLPGTTRTGPQRYRVARGRAAGVGGLSAAEVSDPWSNRGSDRQKVGVQLEPACPAKPR